MNQNVRVIGEKMDFRRILCSELKKYNDVIIYGYADIGQCVLNYIIEFETSIKIANYSGRVKYFAHSNKKESARVEKRGIPIRRIWDLQEYAKKALVIVATQEQHHKDISSVLDELGFENRIYITHEAYCEIRESVENHKELTDNRVMQYHLNHQIKLERLRRKVREGKKVKVFFLTHDAAVFGLSSVYKAMEQDTMFDPYIYVVSRRAITAVDFFEEVLRDVGFFEKRGYKVINGFDSAKNPKDLHEFSPDILFYDIPKLYGECGNFYHRLEQLNWEYLTCYVPYGLYMVDSFYYHYHTMCIRETWKFFLETSASFKRVLADGSFCGFNTVLSGYPKLDDYDKAEVEENLPEKLKNKNKTVIYAPHHSLGVSNNFATFDLYKDIFLDMVKSNPDINFVFKPHPLLPYQIKRLHASNKISVSYEEYIKYIKEWDDLPNGVCLTQGDYVSIFKHSSCMITDCGSFIGEYLPSLHPCIYIFNPRKSRQDDVYTPLAKEILDTYYVCRTREELEKQLEEVLIKGEDSKKLKREEVFRNEFKNIGCAGEYICDFIKKQIMD